MSGTVKSTGYGLFAAGAVLTTAYFWGAYLQGNAAFSDVLNPLTMKNYVALAPLAPGAFLIWLGNLMAARHR